MTDISLLVFTQENCPPCYRLKEYINRLPVQQQELIEFVPLRTASGQLTALAEECHVELTPTLVVAAEHVECTDDDGIEVCDLIDEPIETIVGGQAITIALPGVIKNYSNFEFV
tara:strand:+ start:4299 stop:4640 length:342 start_codon:yes stop_codon:yes gene_type:complete